MRNSSTTLPISESTVIFLVACVQFVNIMDFMMVMPLGPDFTRDLGVDSALVGLIGASYTFSAAFAAILSASVIDRFDRRNALAFALLGLSLSTASAALANDALGLFAARLAAGFFGGPAMSVAMAIMIDHVSEHRRGRAIGFVMSAFSLATIAGIPMSLELAFLCGWQLPFIATGLATFVVLLAVLVQLPAQTAHLSHPAPPIGFQSVARDGTMKLALLITAFSVFSGFLLIPQLSIYFQFNLGFPRKDIGSLYMLGGITSLVLLHITGRYVDRYSCTPAAWFAMLLIVTIIGGGYVLQLPWPVWLLFAGFMGANAIRNVAVQTLSSRVPAPPQRAGFLATQSAVRYIASGVAALLATAILSQDSQQNLINMEWVALLAVFIALPIPLLVQRLQRRLGAP